MARTIEYNSLVEIVKRGFGARVLHEHAQNGLNCKGIICVQFSTIQVMRHIPGYWTLLALRKVFDRMVEDGLLVQLRDVGVKQSSMPNAKYRPLFELPGCKFYNDSQHFWLLSSQYKLNNYVNNERFIRLSKNTTGEEALAAVRSKDAL